MKKILDSIQKELVNVQDLDCCLKRVWRRRSLNLGFGDKIYHGDDSLIDDYKGEWEFRTFYSSWRVVRYGVIICASNELADTTEELQGRLSNLALGKFKSLYMLTEFDISVELSNDTRIDFLATDSDPDEDIIHIYGPKGLFIGYSISQKWYISSPDEQAPIK